MDMRKRSLIDSRWKRLEVEYCDAGMSEEQIAAMKEYDWAWFCSQRVFQMIITAQWSRQSGKVRAIVPMAQSHFDFACLFWTCWSTACQGRSRYSGALAAFTSSVSVSNLSRAKS